MTDKEEFLRKLIELKDYEARMPLYNIIGSEGDHNTRALVDNALEEIEEDLKNE